MKPIKFESVDEYFASLSKNVATKLKEIRWAVKKAAPEAEELLSYQMPAFKLHKRILVYYAAWKEHIGFYSFTSSIKKFKKELSKYETSKGTIKFPFDKPLPLGLISRIVKFRAQENLEKSKKKKGY